MAVNGDKKKLGAEGEKLAVRYLKKSGYKILKRNYKNQVRKQRYISGAKYYFCNREIDCTVRFDIIEIYRGQLNHIENAFYQ